MFHVRSADIHSHVTCARPIYFLEIECFVLQCKHKKTSHQTTTRRREPTNHYYGDTKHATTQIYLLHHHVDIGKDVRLYYCVCHDDMYDHMYLKYYSYIICVCNNTQLEDVLQKKWDCVPFNTRKTRKVHQYH